MFMPNYTYILESQAVPVALRSKHGQIIRKGYTTNTDLIRIAVAVLRTFQGSEQKRNLVRRGFIWTIDSMRLESRIIGANSVV